MTADTSERLVEQGDIDELTRHADRLCVAAAEDPAVWDDVVDLRDRCRRAWDRGKQLWPVASLCEYRIALLAPAPWAGRMVREGAIHLGLGPVAEVVASTHTWADLSPHVDGGPLREVVAAERVVRGDAAVAADPSLSLDVPPTTLAWEPRYLVPTYHADDVDLPGPTDHGVGWEPLPLVGSMVGPMAVEDRDVIDALLGLTSVWVQSSNGASRAVAVEGGVCEAVAAMGVGLARRAELALPEAMRRMAWAAASGGAHGRRRGSAFGRWSAWWTLAAITDMLDDWPLLSHDTLAELSRRTDHLRWFALAPHAAQTGWWLHLAVEDLTEGLAWATSATDHP